MILFQEYLQSDYPGFASFIDTIILPIFGDHFKAVANFDDMVDCLNDDPDELEYYDEIEKSSDESLKHMAAESGLERILKLGTIQVQGDTRPIYVYDITVSKRRQLSRNRKGIQFLITRTLNNQSGAFMLFHYGDAKWEWRFSYKFVGKDKEDTTNSKRFTYLFGQNQVCKTAAQRFTNLLNKKDNLAFDDITEAFSVEALSNEFFTNYKWHYERFCQFIYDNKNDRRFFGEDFSKWEDKIIRDYVKKLLGRIVFLHFLQKKGWLGVPSDKQWGEGDLQFMNNLFNVNSQEQKANYLDNVLEPLFEDINSLRKDDLAGEWSRSYSRSKNIAGLKVPYLNGGLFEREVMDVPKSKFPADYFAELFDFFNQYNFTIDENDPNDSEVGIDPEMLGRIFENLLEDNKDKGAFYTPKEIVQYMCRESLIAYLQTDVEEESKASLRKFVVTHDVGELRSADVYMVDKKLREVKICDPAIGSGAFPMGLLKELFDCRIAIEGTEEGKTPADVKKDIIQNSIYGVDIEKGAVDIARLRFWLSLIIDEQTPHALPNMDFKIMQGNSLLEQYDGFDLSTIMSSKKKVEGPVQMTLFEDSVDVLRRQLIALRRSYYRETDKGKKKAIRQSMQDIVQQQIDALSYKVDLSKIDIAENSEFFLWHTWFSDVFENSGFDIVIGNPPYIQLQANEGLLAELYHNKGFESFNRTGDIFSLFYEQGWRLLKHKGLLCYITSNKWMRNDSGIETRKFFAVKTNPELIFDFAGLQLFENATVETNILLFTKEENRCKTIAVTTNTQTKNVLENLEQFANENGTIMSFDNEEDWIILSNEEATIQKKITKIALPLKDKEIEINFGIKTGYNSAFIIDDNTKKDILENCNDEDEKRRTEELIVPVIRGRDTKRYLFNWANLWLINTHNGLQGEMPPVDITNYPSLKNYLDRYWDKLSARSDKGITPYNLRNCAYLKEFSKPKIIWGEISDRSKFCFDEEGRFYCEATTFFMTGEISLFLLCYLNSKLSEYLFSKIATRTGMGTTRWKKYKIEKLLIPKVSEGAEKEIENNYQRYVESSDSKWLNEIDKILYHIFSLTYDEVLVVDPETPITREEYEKNH